MALKIPPRLKSLLEKDSALLGGVTSSLASFSPWIEDNNLPFFPEYTDHGSSHINNVLLAAEGIISDDAWPKLTSHDSALLILSVLLHDIAMHITEDGFIQLISAPREINSLFFSKDKPWNVLWEDFQGEASRFDGRKLRALFGEAIQVRRPPLDRLQLTRTDKLLIGEFLRRHHGRLAFEIAHAGVPGPTRIPLALADVPREIADLAGFAARSHSIDLREAVDCLERTDQRVRSNSHITFLMATLRIADYIQLQRERAPSQILQVRALSSPVSRGEWSKHSAIREISCVHDDPEALYVRAEPEDIETFAGLSSLLQGLQRELDQAWAVLGEVYGRVQGLQDLRITIRRVRSNLDDVEEFAKTTKTDYVPRPIRFTTAGADLLNLLVAPLYGNAPEIGIRELIQNAVDACRERTDYESQMGLPNKKNTVEGFTGGVVVQLEANGSGTGILRVTDCGVGMTLDIIENYFLRIGASFRYSDLWKQQHLGEDGHSRVHRSGRFGVGALAAFLLGDRVHVETRHVSAPRNGGFAFSCGVNDDLIEVKPCARDVGTVVTITITDKAIFEKLVNGQESATAKWGYVDTETACNWDWYCLSTPSVLRYGPNSSKPLTQEYTFPGFKEPRLEGWREIHAPGFPCIQWIYRLSGAGDRRWFSQTLACNGILIRNRNGLTVNFSQSNDFGIAISPGSESIRARYPSLNVFDPDCQLPLNLQRDALATSELPFASELTGSVAKDFLAFLLEALPEAIPKSSDDMQKLLSLRYAGDVRYRDLDSIFYCLLTKDGWLPIDRTFIANARCKSITVLPLSDGGKDESTLWDYVRKSPDNVLLRTIRSRSKTSMSWSIRSSIERPLTALGKAEGGRLLLQKSDYRELQRPGYIPKYLWPHRVIEWEDEKWCILGFGKCIDRESDFGRTLEQLEKPDAFGLFRLYLDDKNFEASPPTPLWKAWNEVSQGLHIPFAKKRRPRLT